MIYIWLIILTLLVIYLCWSNNISNNAIISLQKKEIKRMLISKGMSPSADFEKEFEKIKEEYRKEKLLKPDKFSQKDPNNPQNIDVEKVLAEIRARRKREFKRKTKGEDEK